MEVRFGVTLDTLSAADLTTAPSSYAPFIPTATHNGQRKKFALVTGTNKIKFMQ